MIIMIDVNGYDELNEMIWNNRDKMVLLYFGASWCGPCQQLKDKIKQENNELEDVIVLHLDCDSEENEDIVNDWNISSLPTQIFVHLEDKNVVKDERIEGYDWIKLIMVYNDIKKKKDYTKFIDSIKEAKETKNN